MRPPALDYLSKMKIAVMVRQLDLEGNVPHDRKWKVAKQMVGRRLQAKRLLAKVE
jgi:hypothetical protein